MKILADGFTVRPAPGGQVEIEITGATTTTPEPCVDLTDGAKRLGVSRSTLAAEIQRRPELARRVGIEGKIVIPESSFAALLKPYSPKCRVKITEAT